jgi:hypothetical protein
MLPYTIFLERVNVLGDSKPMNNTDTTKRNGQTGQYAHNLDKVCVCGATKGQHSAHAPYELDDTSVSPVECLGFKLARKAK